MSARARATDSSPLLLRVLLDSDLLDVPQDGRAQVDDVGGGAGDLVDQSACVVLAMAQTGLRPAEHLSAQIHLVHFARGAVAAEQILGGAGADADAPRRTHAGVGPFIVQFRVIDLDAAV